MVLFEQLQAKAFLLLHEGQSLIILNCVVEIAFLSKYLYKLFHLLLNFLDFVIVACRSQVFIFQFKVERHSLLAASVQTSEMFQVIFNLPDYDVDLKCH